MSRACYGAEASTVTHCNGCRPARPKCKWRRKTRWGVCTCDKFHYPHRGGSCSGKDMWAELDKPMRKGAFL